VRVLYLCSSSVSRVSVCQLLCYPHLCGALPLWTCEVVVQPFSPPKAHYTFFSSIGKPKENKQDHANTYMYIYISLATLSGGALFTTLTTLLFAFPVTACRHEPLQMAKMVNQQMAQTIQVCMSSDFEPAPYV
ncbi:unnamed protein product, partial [Discosporangium mesarthrocarpum]